jgi:dipeptidyl-peptidase-4
VDPPDRPRFLRNGSFFFLSERSGYKHIYHFDKGGKAIGALEDGSAKPITDGEWEVHSIVRLDGDAEEVIAKAAKGTKKGKADGEDEEKEEKATAVDGKWVYFTGTRDGWTTTNLYRVRQDGGDIERLTSEPGSHSASVSPGGKYIVDSWSSTEAPTKVVLREVGVSAGQPSVRTLDSNPVYVLDEYRFGRFESIQIPAIDGRAWNSIVIRRTSTIKSVR